MLSALLIHGVPVTCINAAAQRYWVPATVIISVIETEGGWPGLAKPNANGTVDYGPMQINSRWLKRLMPYGYSAQALQFNPCKNVEAGSWILAQQIAQSRTYWQGIGNYHSHTRRFNQAYQQQVSMHYQRLLRTIAYARFF